MQSIKLKIKKVAN